MAQPADLKPSRTRYWVVVFAVTLSIVSYIDRVAMSQAAPFITHDLHLGKEQMGWIFSAFALAYALFEIPGGWLGDYMGPRRVLMRIVLWWSVFTAATGWMWNFASMITTRFLFGAGEAGCFPNLTKSFTTWLPEHERVRAQGIMWMSARWGGALTPLLCAFTFQFVNWRTAFGLYGLLGIVWAVFFFRWFRDDPKDHPKVNAAELKLLEPNRALVGKHGDVPWRKLVRSRSVVLLWIQYFLITYPWYFYITWIVTYVKEYRHVSNDFLAAFYSSFPLLFGGVGCLFSGFILPRVSHLLGGVGRARRGMATAGFFGASMFVLLCIRTQDPMWAMLALGMASFCNDLTMPPGWAACMDVGGKYAGTLSGSMNMMGNLAGFVSPSVAGWLVANTTQSWQAYMYTMAGAYLLGAFTWPFIDPVTPLEES
jgi:MFS family permease